jgi:peptide/nickel transport system substrate-binding protein
MDGSHRISRRALLTTAGAGTIAWSLGEWGVRPASAAKNVLVIGIDISDTNFLDPARQFVYSAPMTIRAAYEALLTMTPGDYETLRPLLATKWERVDDGNAWQLHLREGVKFTSGNPLTAEDVKFSFDRLKNLKDSPADLAANFKSTDVVDTHTVKITMDDKNQPLITLLTSPTFVITDSRTIMAHNGASGSDASTKDKASQWLDQSSAGTGPYILKQWERNSQIVLERNNAYWRKPAAFQRVIIKHIPESETQVITLKRGDIDAALNLTARQLDSLKGASGIRIVQGRSLDFVYMTLTSSTDLNAALAKKEARQAVAYAIDYDGLIKALLEGYAVRPPNFIPVGMGGVTTDLTKQIGYRYDPARSKDLLQKAGLPNGFSFELSYGNAAIVGTSYQLIAEKIQADLAKVGISAKLNPMDQATMRTKFLKGETQSVLTFWNPDFADPWDWAEPTVHRVAKRVHWDVPAKASDLMTKGAGATTKKESDANYLELQKILVDEANYLVLFQPVYRYATRTSITGWKPTAAGWIADLYDVQPT